MTYGENGTKKLSLEGWEYVNDDARRGQSKTTDSNVNVGVLRSKIKRVIGSKKTAYE